MCDRCPGLKRLGPQGQAPSKKSSVVHGTTPPNDKSAASPSVPSSGKRFNANARAPAFNSAGAIASDRMALLRQSRRRVWPAPHTAYNLCTTSNMSIGWLSARSDLRPFYNKESSLQAPKGPSIRHG